VLVIAVCMPVRLMVVMVVVRVIVVLRAVLMA
jgi:hypothetical protein